MWNDCHVWEKSSCGGVWVGMVPGGGFLFSSVFSPGRGARFDGFRIENLFHLLTNFIA